MKEGLGEVVEPGLSDNCLQISDSKSLQILALRLCPDSNRVTNIRVQEDSCSRLHIPRKFRQSAVQRNRLFYFYFWVNFP